jgi:hypothetical protein
VKRERRKPTAAELRLITSRRPVVRPEVPYTVRSPGPNGGGCPAERGEANEGREGAA